jgi:membrane protein implicated in regulation of membrane protease activity
VQPIFVADTGDAYSDVEHVFLPVAVVVFAVFAGLIVVLAWRGSRRKQSSSRANNLALEVGYAVVLI